MKTKSKTPFKGLVYFWLQEVSDNPAITNSVMSVVFFIFFAVLRFAIYGAPPQGTTRRLRLVGIYQALVPTGPLEVILHSQFSGPASFRTLRSCGVTSVKIFRCEKSRMAASTAPITSEMVQAVQMPVSPFSPALVNSTGTM